MTSDMGREKVKDSYRPFAFLVLIALLGQQTACFGQAYCALRDPTRRIYELFPDATSYKSIVRSVDESIRRRVSNELPFTIHFNELGRHTLYLPIEDGRPLGLVHARSEASDRGLTEIVWSLSPKMVVQDFSFQRCRSRKRSEVETDRFKRQIIGRDYQQLRRLLTDDGNSIRPNTVSVSADAAGLAASVIRSALKTIVVTELAWESDLRVIRPLYLGFRAFPDANHVELVDAPYSPIVQDQLAAHVKDDNGTHKSSIDRDQVVALRMRAADGSTMGHLIKTPWKSLDESANIWWKVRKDVVIDEVFAERGWKNAKTGEAFKAVEGLAIESIHDCASAAEMVGAEVLLISRHN